MTGEALSGNFDYGSSAFGSDFTFYRGGVGWEQGIKFFKSHNLVYSASATAGHNLPFWNENTAGGTQPAWLPRPAVSRRHAARRQARVPLPALLDQLARLSRARVLRRSGGLVPERADRHARDRPQRLPTPRTARATSSATPRTRGRSPRCADRLQPRQHPQRRRCRAPLLPSLGRGAPGRGRLRLRDRSRQLAVHHRRRRLGRRPRPGCWKVVR